MTEKEVFNICCSLAGVIQDMPACETREILVSALYIITEQQRDIDVLSVSLHDLAKEVDFGQ